ncbi:MAG: MBL fold metallo-hydrolase, partial [Bradyrhizobium sp.]
MQVQFVGCGDAFGSGGRLNTCFHVTGNAANFLIDCGASSLPALKRAKVDRNAVELILITHFHGDHFAGLPFFLLDAQFSRRTGPLVIAGPQGIETRLTQVMETLFENSSRTAQKFALSVVSLEPEQAQSFGAVRVTPFPVVHGESGGPFLAYRIEVEGRVLAYTADTEWTETLVPLGRNADLFIAEAYTYE